ncbi:hypothetical protein GN958_ATG02145 [Phytophthora infestans]|uniref:Uncharacterized protein n=1 Tax=Phytophthora infestans TaxID=4787 RepID=A0A8S9V6D0_PHYIN|nr:hypothetical protein GN958_ATG02145 [Phytophthora infestans]
MQIQVAVKFLRLRRREGGARPACFKVEELVALALEACEPKTVRLDKSIYLNLGINALQREWVPIAASNWLANLDTVQANYQRRSKAGPLVIELIVFVAKAQSGIRRATASRVEEVSRLIDSHLREHPDVQVGEIARTDWAFSHARQPDQPAIALPDNATSHQAQHIDAMRAAQIQQQSDRDEPMRMLTVSLNGSTPLRLTFNISELRDMFGLPNYNFLAQGSFSKFQPPGDPEDVEDTDHQ